MDKEAGRATPEKSETVPETLVVTMTTASHLAPDRKKQQGTKQGVVKVEGNENSS